MPHVLYVLSSADFDKYYETFARERGLCECISLLYACLLPAGLVCGGGGAAVVGWLLVLVGCGLAAAV